MGTIKAGRLVRGSAFVKFAILLMLLAGLGLAVDYRMSIPGSSVVDRLYAKPVVLDMASSAIPSAGPLSLNSTVSMRAL